MWFIGMMMYVVANAAAPAPTPPAATTHHNVVRDECGNVFVDGVALRNPVNRRIGDFCIVGSNSVEDPSRIQPLTPAPITREPANFGKGRK